MKGGEMLNIRNGVIRIPGGRKSTLAETGTQSIDGEILVFWEPKPLPEKPKPKPKPNNRFPTSWESRIQHSVSGRGRRKKRK
jgi:hypothetical protein